MGVHRARFRATVALVGWVFLVGLVTSGLPTAAAQPAEQAPRCCFVNVSYSGTCAVDPAPGETCASILEYLNTPNTVGKTYCGGTRIRGGWTVAKCEGEATGEDDSLSFRVALATSLGDGVPRCGYPPT